MSDLVITGALSELRGLLVSEAPPNPAQLSLLLRALQRRGLSRMDLVVHIERLRAQNDVKESLESTEENALLALEMIDGATRLGVSWNAVETAAAWVPLALSRSDVASGATHALSPSDLLPSRPERDEVPLREMLVEQHWSRLDLREYAPTTADFFRAPKAGLTTRPAAVLAPQDRLVFEGFAEVVASVSSEHLPEHVVWPRGREITGTHGDFVKAPQDWSAEFILRTDIAAYYESINHTFLSVILARQLGLRGAFPIALEAFLDAVMNSEIGLPQGPPGSDVLASAYLIDVDQEMARRGWPVARFADDILIGASSFDEARTRLRELEGLLRGRGLRLANEKTRIIRTNTYLATLDSDGTGRRLQDRVKIELAKWFDENPDSDHGRIIEAIELPEQLQWDVLYHQTISWADALEEIGDLALPPWVRAYERVFAAEAQRLADGGYPDEPEALSVSDLRKCLLFMRTDAQLVDLRVFHSVIDWHPSLVRDICGYLETIAEASPRIASDFLVQRLEREHDSDLEMAWLLEPSVRNTVLAELLRDSLTMSLDPKERPLTSATSLRALDGIGALAEDKRRQLMRSFTPALGAEVALSLDRAHRAAWIYGLDGPAMSPTD